MTEDVTRIRKVQPSGDCKLRLHFVGESKPLQVDLTGLIGSSKHFAPLIRDADAFAGVVIVEEGLAVAWPVETAWGRLDVSASTLKRIAEEQRPTTGPRSRP